MTLVEQVGSNWSNREVVRKVRNGLLTNFSVDPWVENIPLRVGYPRLYSLSTQKLAKVGDFWNCNHGLGEWFFSWRWNLFVWETDLFNGLLRLIGGLEVSGDKDYWVGKLEEGGGFSLKYCYSLL